MGISTQALNIVFNTVLSVLLQGEGKSQPSLLDPQALHTVTIEF